MKNLVAFTCFLIATVTAHHIKEEVLDKYFGAVEKQLNDCSAELKIESGLVRKFINNDASADEKSAGCLQACVFKNLGAMVDGKLKVEGLYDFVEKIHHDEKEKIEPLKHIIEDCVNKANEMEDECMKSAEITKCYHTNAASVLA